MKNEEQKTKPAISYYTKTTTGKLSKLMDESKKI